MFVPSCALSSLSEFLSLSRSRSVSFHSANPFGSNSGPDESQTLFWRLGEAFPWACRWNCLPSGLGSHENEWMNEWNGLWLNYNDVKACKHTHTPQQGVFSFLIFSVDWNSSCAWHKTHNVLAVGIFLFISFFFWWSFNVVEMEEGKMFHNSYCSMWTRPACRATIYIYIWPTFSKRLRWRVQWPFF